MRILRNFALAFSFGATAYSQAPAPKQGFVPNAATAIKIAEAVFGPIYGEEKIKAEEPFHASLQGNIWTVSGSLPEQMVGGVATIRIDKNTGAIISYIHGK